MLSDLWYVNTSSFSESYTPDWILLTPSGSQSPAARHGFGMFAIRERIVVTGGWVQTSGSGTVRSKDMWIMEHLADADTNSKHNSDTQAAPKLASWTNVIPEGVVYASTPRSNFAAVSVGVTVAVIGGDVNAGALSDLQLLDLCSHVQCGVGFKSTCEWNVIDDKRGKCIPCAENENCCRAATYTAEEGICEGMRVTLNSCSRFDTQWDVLLQFFAPEVFMNTSKCINDVKAMCMSIESPGIIQGSARHNPLLCQRPFLCASDSPFGSLKLAQTKACNVQGTECTASDKPNVVCCSYIEYLITESCEPMDADYVGYLARSRFPTCRDFNCYSPALLQFTATAMNEDAHHLKSGGGYWAQQGPSARTGVTAAVIGTSVFIYGGYKSSGEYSKELWELSAEAYPPKWYDYTNVRGGPVGRRYAAIAVLEPAGKILVHGGEGPDFLLDDLYVLDVRRPSLDMPYMWMDLTSLAAGDVPSARCMHSMIGVGASEAYIFGGSTLFGLSDKVSVRMCVCVYVCVHACMKLQRLCLEVNTYFCALYVRVEWSVLQFCIHDCSFVFFVYVHIHNAKCIHTHKAKFTTSIHIVYAPRANNSLSNCIPVVDSIQ